MVISHHDVLRCPLCSLISLSKSYSVSTSTVNITFSTDLFLFLQTAALSHFSGSPWPLSPFLHRLKTFGLISQLLLLLFLHAIYIQPITSFWAKEYFIYFGVPMATMLEELNRRNSGLNNWDVGHVNSRDGANNSSCLRRGIY